MLTTEKPRKRRMERERKKWQQKTKSMFDWKKIITENNNERKRVREKQEQRNKRERINDTVREKMARRPNLESYGRSPVLNSQERQKRADAIKPLIYIQQRGNASIANQRTKKWRENNETDWQWNLAGAKKERQQRKESKSKCRITSRICHNIAETKNKKQKNTLSFSVFQ